MKLGKLAPVIDPRTLRMTALRAAGEAPAPTIDWTPAVDPSEWGTLGNDRYGNCTAAACCHLTHAWKANLGQEWKPTEEQALDLYADTSDYPKADNGAVVLEVLKFWAKNGTPSDAEPCIFASLNTRDEDDYRFAIEWFGGVYLGLNLPLSVATNPDIWTVSSGSRAVPGSWGGHAVVAVAYDKDYVTIVTWGTVRKLSWAFLLKYCDEAYAVASRTWLDQFGMAPSRLTWDVIQANLNKIKG